MRKEDVKEKMLINKIIDLRKIEIRDKIERSQVFLNIEDLGKKFENYIINAFPGKQVNYVLNDYEKKDEA